MNLNHPVTVAAIIVVILLITAWGVMGQETRFSTDSMPPPIVAVPSCFDYMKDLPQVAERLGIAPGSSSGTVVLTMCDGRTYDLFALVNALLDRMDKAATK